MTQTVALISRALHALRTSLQRDGVVGTLKKGPKLVRYVTRRIKDADYYRRYWAIEREEGFDQKYGTDTSKMVETFELGAAGPNAKQAVRYSAFMGTDLQFRQRLGIPLPEGVAIDEHGRPTTDAGAAPRGAILPFGGHKGYALALAIPGERAYRDRARLAREGIEIDRRIHDALIQLGEGRRGA